MKIKLDQNDIIFSKMIRERDGKCVFCGKTAEHAKLEASHFWSRGCKSTRFDTRNVEALCFYCHLTNEGNKQGKYREYKLQQLGEQQYNELERLHNQTKQYGKYEKKKLNEILKEQYKNKDHLKPDWQVIW